MRYKAICAYDGYPYAGFQHQINGPSIQDEIEKALAKIEKEPVTIYAAGRTDAKVHALGQVFHFDSKLDLNSFQWLNALNTLLPPDIRIKSVEKVPENFHARFDAKGKRYRYIYTLDQADPFAFRQKSLLFKAPDLALMKKGAKLLEGEHDFSSFARMHPPKEGIRTIDSITIEEKGKEIHLIYTGNGFLRHQVRRMSEALVMLGLGKISLEELKDMIENRRICPYKAKGQGLYLEEVFYEPLKNHYSSLN